MGTPICLGASFYIVENIGGVKFQKTTWDTWDMGRSAANGIPQIYTPLYILLYKILIFPIFCLASNPVWDIHINLSVKYFKFL